MNDKLFVGFAAAFGGVAPNVFRVATRLTGGADLPGLSYLIGMLMFAAMGACTALFFEETELKKAFFLGLGLPAMFQSGVNDLSVPADRAAVLFAPAVLAAESSEPGPIPLVILPVDAPPYKVAFRSSTERRREVVEVNRPGNRQKLEAPAWARTFVVSIGESTSKPKKLMRGRSPPTFRLRVRRLPWSGLKEAVGVRGVAAYEILVERDEGEEEKRK